jgi:transcriptional regulator NrdR family protein
VPIDRLFANSAFDPDKVRIMVEAYECACRQLELSGDHVDQLTQLVAKKVIEKAQAEVRLDAKLICEQSLAELRIPKY